MDIPVSGSVVCVRVSSAAFTTVFPAEFFIVIPASDAGAGSLGNETTKLGVADASALSILNKPDASSASEILRDGATKITPPSVFVTETETPAAVAISEAASASAVSSAAFAASLPDFASSEASTRIAGNSVVVCKLLIAACTSTISASDVTSTTRLPLPVVSTFKPPSAVSSVS